MSAVFCAMPSPLGPLLLVGNGVALTGLYMADHSAPPTEAWQRDDAAVPFVAARAQLTAYFAGTRKTFDLPLEPAGTPFQHEVWRALQTIAYGQTVSYGDLAQRLGRPSASRAVGLANGQNPLSIVVPCHRVIGATGSLTGYGGGVTRKAWLLALEKGQPLPSILPPQLPLL